MLFNEFPMALQGIHADSENNRPLADDLGVAIPQAAGLLRASRRVILRIEVQDNRTTAKIREADTLPLLTVLSPHNDSLEIGGLFTGCEQLLHAPDFSIPAQPLQARINFLTP